MPHDELAIHRRFRYFDFEGRSSRAEFWWFYLGHIVIGFLIGLIDNGVFPDLPLEQWPLMTVYVAVSPLPALGVGARRWYDVGRSGWWQALVYVPRAATVTLPWFAESIGLITLMLTVLGLLVLTSFAVRAGQAGANAYGEPIN